MQAPVHVHVGERSHAVPGYQNDLVIRAYVGGVRRVLLKDEFPSAVRDQCDDRDCCFDGCSAPRHARGRMSFSYCNDHCKEICPYYCSVNRHDGHCKSCTKCWHNNTHIVAASHVVFWNYSIFSQISDYGFAMPNGSSSLMFRTVEQFLAAMEAKSNGQTTFSVMSWVSRLPIMARPHGISENASTHRKGGSGL